jgi:pentatricopeptide repeat protein
VVQLLTVRVCVCVCVCGNTDAGHWGRALEVLADMRETAVAPDTTTYNTVLAACMQARQAQWAWRVLAQMDQASVPRDVVTYHVLLTELEKRKDWNGVVDMLARMRLELPAEVVRHSTRVWRAEVRASAEQGRGQLAWSALGSMLEAGCISSHAVLDAVRTAVDAASEVSRESEAATATLRSMLRELRVEQAAHAEAQAEGKTQTLDASMLEALTQAFVEGGCGEATAEVLCRVQRLGCRSADDAPVGVGVATTTSQPVPLLSDPSDLESSLMASISQGHDQSVQRPTVERILRRDDVGEVTATRSGQ